MLRAANVSRIQADRPERAGMSTPPGRFHLEAVAPSPRMVDYPRKFPCDQCLNPCSTRSMDEDYSKPIRAVSKLQPLDSYLSGSWEALGAGAPVLVALAQLCGQAMVAPPVAPDELSESLLPEAQAILVAARNRGVIELKAVNTAFDPAARMLAVYVELDEAQTIAFRDPHHPEVTVTFLEGFRQLCRLGLVMHHIHRDFSLTLLGFQVGRTIDAEEVQPWLDKGTEFGLHD